MAQFRVDYWMYYFLFCIIIIDFENSFFYTFSSSAEEFEILGGNRGYFLMRRGIDQSSVGFWPSFPTIIA